MDLNPNTSKKSKRHVKPESFQVESLEPKWFHSPHPLDKYDNFKLNRTLYSAHYLYYKKDYTKALQVISSLNLKNVQIVEFTCQCFIKLNRYEEALEFWNSHISKTAKEPFILYFSGLLHLLNGNVTTSMDFFFTYLNFRREDIEGWKQLHYCFVKAAELSLSRDFPPSDYLLWAAYCGKKAVLIREKSRSWMDESVLPCKLDLTFHTSFESCLNSLEIPFDTNLKDLPSLSTDCLDSIGLSEVQKEYLKHHLIFN